MLNILTTGSILPDHKLTLKRGLLVMLLPITYPFMHHKHGACYIGSALHSNILVLDLLTGNNAGKILVLPNIPCGPGDSTFPVQGFSRAQISVSLCFAITVNQAPGQSFSGVVELNECDTVFSPGQLYVGASGAMNHSQLKVCDPSKSDC